MWTDNITRGQPIKHRKGEMFIAFVFNADYLRMHCEDSISSLVALYTSDSKMIQYLSKVLRTEIDFESYWHFDTLSYIVYQYIGRGAGSISQSFNRLALKSV